MLFKHKYYLMYHLKIEMNQEKTHDKNILKTFYKRILEHVQGEILFHREYSSHIT